MRFLRAIVDLSLDFGHWVKGVVPGPISFAGRFVLATRGKIAQLVYGKGNNQRNIYPAVSHRGTVFDWIPRISVHRVAHHWTGVMRHDASSHSRNEPVPVLKPACAEHVFN
jgi:hypothetical protein